MSRLNKKLKERDLIIENLKEEMNNQLSCSAITTVIAVSAVKEKYEVKLLYSGGNTSAFLMSEYDFTNFLRRPNVGDKIRIALVRDNDDE